MRRTGLVISLMAVSFVAGLVVGRLLPGVQSLESSAPITPLPVQPEADSFTPIVTVLPPTVSPTGAAAAPQPTLRIGPTVQSQIQVVPFEMMPTARLIVTDENTMRLATMVLETMNAMQAQVIPAEVNAPVETPLPVFPTAAPEIQPLAVPTATPTTLTPLYVPPTPETLPTWTPTPFIPAPRDTGVMSLTPPLNRPSVTTGTLLVPPTTAASGDEGEAFSAPTAAPTFHQPLTPSR